MPDVRPLARRINEKARQYEQIAEGYWQQYDTTSAIRYRAMAEAYRIVLEEDLTWFAQEGGGG